MATLQFICGKAASGKTTLARELAARHAAVLFGEDEWLTRLDAESVPIVFDFAGNTPNDRAWVRSIFESANADHVLHYLVASDESCKTRLRLRNDQAGRTLFRLCQRRPVR
jgi:predicted kinase